MQGVALGSSMDLNSDVGESFGQWEIGADAQVIPLVTSVNIACGWHAGDPTVMRTTVELARQHGVAVGAHPGYPDLQGFGRRAMALSPDEITDGTLYQIGALAAFTRAAGVLLMHVKPHGAVYNLAAKDERVASAIARAVRAFDPDLVLVGLSNSALTAAGEQAGLRVAHEGFIDRRYEPNGMLRARQAEGALLDQVSAVEQALGLAQRGGVRTADGGWLAVRADTLCIHGDSPEAAQLAQAVRAAFDAAGIVIAPFRQAT
ncbi:MAG: LamB/YcsF family protein [Herpetosiphonaceae bacterium]|nr:LamB/YcsF family protein [Herpetosiphonaceae bacterium]